jgi:hypothetical protein
MAMFHIAGGFRIIGAHPDGDSIHFRRLVDYLHLGDDSMAGFPAFLDQAADKSDGRRSRSRGHSHTAHAAVERLSGHPVWNGDLGKNAGGLLYRLLNIPMVGIGFRTSVTHRYGSARILVGLTGFEPATT